jgi:hypothetical protein
MGGILNGLLALLAELNVLLLGLFFDFIQLWIVPQVG